MRGNLLKIRNFLGIQELDIKLGVLTLIEGENATGKTSIIEALKALVSGGYDATLLRHGTESGEVVLVLDNGQEIIKPIEHKRTEPIVKDPKYGKLKKPQTIIDRLHDALSFNPISFLNAPPDKRAQWLLEILPLEVDPQQVQAAAGILLDRSDVRPNALDTINHVRQKVYDRRTGVNRVADEKKKTVGSLRAQLPEQTSEDCGAEINRTIGELEIFQAQYLKDSTALTTELQHRIDELKKEAEQRIERIRLELDQAIQYAREAEEAQRLILEQERDPVVDRLRANLATLQERAAQHERAKSTREMIEQFEVEQKEGEEESQRLTAGLKNLDGLKLQLLQSLPIKGLEVRDGQVFKDGIPFERVNRAKQVAVALQIAKLRAGDLPLVCVDNLECLDSATFEAFERAAVKSGLQLVVTRVTEGPLTIETRGEPQ